MNNDDVFAYVFEEDLIRSALPDWPQGMIAVLCLRADGDCKTVVGHIEEGHRVLRRVAQAMDMPERSFAVTPEVDGWPTRRVRFSEEQDMLKLIAGADHLSELAADYAINYRFAKDEGLNPDEVVSGRAPQRAPRADKPATKVGEQVRRRLHLGLAVGERVAKALTDRGETEDVPSRPQRGDSFGMPPGFAACTAPSRRDCQFGTGRIGGYGKGIRVILTPDRVSIHTTPVKVEEVGFSSDFRHFYLPRKALGDWRASRPAIIDIAPEAFPEGLRKVMADRWFQVDATVTAEGVFLTPGLPIAPEAEAEVVSEDIPTAEPRKRWRMSGRAAAIAGVGLVVALITAGSIGAFVGDAPVTSVLSALEIAER